MVDTETLCVLQVLFAALAECVLRQPDKFAGISLCNVARAFATLGVQHRALFDAIEQHLDPASLQDTQLAEIAWSFATLGLKPEALFEQLASYAPVSQ